MTVTIFGLLGHANKVRMSLDSLEMEEMAPGEEFVFNGKVYEIRSVAQDKNGFLINVSLVLYEAQL
ncbi:MAG: hypothetical protein V3S64_14430 [bacterium]